MLAPRTLLANLLATQDGAAGGEGSASALGVAAEAQEPVVVAVAATVFLSDVSIAHCSWRMLA